MRPAPPQLWAGIQDGMKRNREMAAECLTPPSRAQLCKQLPCVAQLQGD